MGIGAVKASIFNNFGVKREEKEKERVNIRSNGYPYKSTHLLLLLCKCEHCLFQSIRSSLRKALKCHKITILRIGYTMLSSGALY